MDQINNKPASKTAGVQHKPESELPWKCMPYCDMYGIADYLLDKDEAFILHACNAYPKMVKFLKEVAKIDFDRMNWCWSTYTNDLLKDLGEDGPNN